MCIYDGLNLFKFLISNLMLYIIPLLQKLGVPPDLASYNILLKTCCNAREFNSAQEIYEEIKKKEHDGILKLDVFTYSTMMKVRDFCSCQCSFYYYHAHVFCLLCIYNVFSLNFRCLRKQKCGRWLPTSKMICEQLVLVLI